MISARDAFADTAAFSRARARPLAPEHRRELILGSVIPLLREHGRDVSTRQLAEAAGVAEGTLFRAFGDKETLIAAAIEKIFDHGALIHALRAVDPDAPIDDKLAQVMGFLNAHFRELVAAVVALGLRERPPVPDHAAHEGALTQVLRDVLAPDLDQLSVPLETATEYVRLVAFAAALPMAADLDSDELSALIARGIVRREGDA